MASLDDLINRGFSPERLAEKAQRAGDSDMLRQLDRRQRQQDQQAKRDQREQQKTLAQAEREQRSAQRDQERQNRDNARTMTHDAVAWFTTPDGRHIPITAPSGGAMKKYDNSGVLWDENTGKPYKVENGSLRDASDDGNIVTKDGSVYKVAPGQEWKWVGYDQNNIQPDKSLTSDLARKTEQVNAIASAATGLETALTKDIASDRKRLKEIDGQMFQADEATRASLTKEKETLQGQIAAKEERQSQAELDSYRAQADKLAWTDEKARLIQENIDAKRDLSVDPSSFPNTARLPDATSQVGIGSVAQPSRQVDITDPMGDWMDRFAANYNNQTVQIGDNQVEHAKQVADAISQPDVVGEWTKSAMAPKLAQDFADRAPVPIKLPDEIAQRTGLTYAPESWFTPDAMERQLTAKLSGQDKMNLPKGYRLDGGTIYAPQDEPVKVFGVQLPWLKSKQDVAIGQVVYDDYGVGSIRINPDSKISPSFLSQDYYRGLPEYSAPSKSFVDSFSKPPKIGSQVVDEVRKEAMDAFDQRGTAESAWDSRRWSATDTRDFLDKWQTANDAQRAEMIAEVDPRQAGRAPQDRKLDGKFLYDNGFVSAQDARLINKTAYGQEPSIAPISTTFDEWVKNGTSQLAINARRAYAAVKDRKIGFWETLASKVSVFLPAAETLRQNAAVTNQAKQAFLTEYYQTNAGKVDFNLPAFTAARDSLLGAQNPVTWAINGLNYSLQTAAASSVGMIAIQAPKLVFDGIYSKVTGNNLLTDQEKELIGAQTQQALRNMTRAVTDRLPSDLGEALAMGQTANLVFNAKLRDKLWSGARGAELNSAVSDLRKAIDSGTLTEEGMKTMAQRIQTAATAFHDGEDSKGGAVADALLGSTGRLDFENNILDPRSAMSRSLAAYMQTMDPSYWTQVENSALNSSFENEIQQRASDYASQNGAISETSFLGPLQTSFRGAQVAPLTETAVEIGSELVDFGLAKALTVGKWMARSERLGLTLNNAGRVLEGMEGLEEKIFEAGKFKEPIGGSLSKGQKAWNSGIDLAKMGSASAISEGLEEVVGGFGQAGATVSDALAQGVQGAIGGVGLTAVHYPVGAVAGGIQIAAMKAADNLAVNKFVADWNKRYAENPITKEQLIQAQAYQNTELVHTLRAKLSENFTRQKEINQQIAALPAPDTTSDTYTPDPRYVALSKEQERLKAEYAATIADNHGILENSLATVQEINGLPENWRAITDAAVKVVSGTPISPEQQQLLLNGKVGDGKSSAYLTGGRMIISDALRAELAKAAPTTSKIHFSKTEAEQLAEAQNLQKGGVENGKTQEQGQRQGGQEVLTQAKDAASSSNDVASPTPSKNLESAGAVDNTGGKQEATQTPISTAPASSGNYAFDVTYLPTGSTQPVTATHKVTAVTPEQAATKRETILKGLSKLGTVQSATELRDATVQTSQSTGKTDKLPENKAFIPAPNTSEWKPEAVRSALSNAAAAFGYKIVDTGIDVGIRSHYGGAEQVVNLGTQVYDKLNPGSEIGQWIDAMDKAKNPIGNALIQGHPIGLHRVWFGHDFATSLPSIVDKFGWAGVPDYIGQLLKDSLTKSGIPFPGVQLLVQSGLVSDRVATDWLSTNIGEVFGGGIAFFGTYRLALAAKKGNLTKPRIVFATIGVGLKLAAGVTTAQPFLVLSGLADAAILVTNLDQIKAAFQKGQEVAKTNPAPAAVEEAQATPSKPENQAQKTNGPPEKAVVKESLTTQQPEKASVSEGDSEAKTVLSIPSKNRVPILEIQTRKLANGRFQSKYQISTQNAGVGTPFFDNQTYATEQQAIDQAKAGVANYVNKTIGRDDTTEIEKEQLKKIREAVTGLVKLPEEVTKKAPASKPAKATKKKPAKNSYEQKLADRRDTYAKQASEATTDKLTETLNTLGDVPAWPTDGIDLMRKQAIEAELSSRGQLPKPAAQPFDSKSFEDERNAKIKESKNAGNKHLDSVRPSVETMRGKEIFYVHNPKQRGVIRTVDNRGSVYVQWSDAESARLESASETAETNAAWLKSSKKLPIMRTVRGGTTYVMQSTLGPTDLKDYVFADSAKPAAKSPAPVDTPSSTVPEYFQGTMNGNKVDEALRQLYPWLSSKKSPAFVLPQVFISPNKQQFSESQKDGWSRAGAPMAAISGKVYIDKANLTKELNKKPESERKAWLELAIDEELDHLAGQSLGREKLELLWNEAPDAGKERTMLTYFEKDVLLAGGDWQAAADGLDKGTLALEFLRIYRQALRKGATTESVSFQRDVDAYAAVNPIFAARFAKALRDIVRFMRDELRNLLTGEARARFDDAISRIEAKRAEIEAKIKDEKSPTPQQQGAPANQTGPDTEANRPTGPPAENPAGKPEGVASKPLTDKEKAFVADLSSRFVGRNAMLMPEENLDLTSGLRSPAGYTSDSRVKPLMTWRQLIDAGIFVRTDIDGKPAIQLATAAEATPATQASAFSDIEDPELRATLEKFNDVLPPAAARGVQRFTPIPPKSLDKALDYVRRGGRLVVRTPLRVTTIDAKALANFEKAGVPLLKEDGNGYRMQNGKKSVVLLPGQLEAEEFVASANDALPPAAAKASDPAFISAASQLSDALWKKGYDTPEKFAAFLHQRFSDRITPKVLSQVWNLGANTDPDVAVNWSNVHAEAIRPTVDPQAHESAASPKNDLEHPTEAQKEAGNFKKGHVDISGLDVSIEQPAGSIRSGADSNGKPWSQQLKSHYGYIKRTTGADGENLDVFIKPGTPLDWHGTVYVVNQANNDGNFDEHKGIIGASDEAEARELYLENYSKGWKGIGSVAAMPFEDFKAWAKEGDLTGPAETWHMFPASSGTLGIPRVDMPQVKIKDRADLLTYLSDKGVRLTETTIPHAKDSLYPSQAEYSESKSTRAKELLDTDRHVFISSDNYIVDGHHQYVAAGNGPLKVVRIGLPIREAIRAVADFPKAKGGTRFKAMSEADVLEFEYFTEKQHQKLLDHKKAVVELVERFTTELTPWYAAYKAFAPEFSRMMRDAASKLGHTEETGMFELRKNPKKIERIVEKSYFEGGVVNGKATMQEAVANLKDVLAATFVVENGQQVEQAVKAIEDATGITRDKWNNKDTIKTGSPFGYRDIKLRIEMQPGIWAEVILITPSMIAAKHADGHPWYELGRSIDALQASEGGVIPDGMVPVKELITEKSKEIYGAAWAEDGFGFHFSTLSNMDAASSYEYNLSTYDETKPPLTGSISATGEPSAKLTNDSPSGSPTATSTSGNLESLTSQNVEPGLISDSLNTTSKDTVPGSERQPETLDSTVKRIQQVLERSESLEATQALQSALAGLSGKDALTDAALNLLDAASKALFRQQPALADVIDEIIGEAPRSLSPDIASPASIIPADTKSLPPNVSFVQVRNYNGDVQGYVTFPHDGTPEGIMASASTARDVVYQQFDSGGEFSNLESINAATDENGKIKWIISPNLAHLSEVGTPQAKYTLGDLNAFDGMPQEAIPQLGYTQSEETWRSPKLGDGEKLKGQPVRAVGSGESLGTLIRTQFRDFDGPAGATGLFVYTTTAPNGPARRSNSVEVLIPDGKKSTTSGPDLPANISQRDMAVLRNRERIALEIGIDPKVVSALMDMDRIVRVGTKPTLRQINELIAKREKELKGTGVEKPASPLPSRDSVLPTTTPQGRAADAILERLRKGEEIDWRELFAITDKAWGGTQADGTYTVKDAYDALELAVNTHILKDGILYDANAEGLAGLARLRMNLNTLSKILAIIPTQSKRTKEQDDMQQFSTPPHFAYVANWVANVRSGDVVLEPSAGIGGIAVFSKLDGATVIANELSERRRAFLKELGFDYVTGENAEQLHAIYTPQIAAGKLPQPTVVVMNPPFSNAAKSGKKGKTIIGASHVEEALKLLPDGGRLVAIVGEGMAIDAHHFRAWWKNIASKYNVRANVWVNGENYKKYGTTFSNRLLVIDKTGKTADLSKIVGGQVDEISQLPTLLEDIRNDRIRNTTTEPASDQTSQPGGSSIAAGDSTSAATGETGNPGGTGGQRPGAVDSQRPGNAGAGTDVTSGDGTTGRPDGEPGGGKESDGSSTGHPASVEAAGSESGSGLATEQSGISIESADNSNRAIENEDDVFSLYKPAKLHIPGAQKHLAPLVESSAMASVTPPDPTYTPNLPKEVITEGRISETSLENIVYAGQAHKQILPNGERRGYLIGDGTGVGKGRQIAGVIMDNMRQGRTKAVWISEKEGLMDDAKRDAEDIGLDPASITFLGKTKKGAKIDKADGIIFSTYSTLKGGHEGILGPIKDWWAKIRGKNESRIGQLVNWLGKDFDGVIAFDEAHNAGNAIAMQGKRGIKRPSATGIAVVDLQAALPKARILYVSATAATEVENLSYADRLGIWGMGTPFPNKLDFFNKIRAGGISAMEIVARDLKAQGLYLARSISYKGVEFSRLTQNLTTEQTDLYNKIAKGWQTVLSNLDSTMGESGANENAMARSAALSAFWGAQQRFFNQLLTAMELPAVLDDMDKELAKGNSLVLQIVNTNEATQNRQIAQRQTEAGPDKADLEDLDLSPRDILLQYLDKSFPTTKFEQVQDPNNPDRTVWVPARDSEGNIIQDPAAVATKLRLMDELALLDVPTSPLDQIINKFGEEAVAEVTGRTQRVVSVKKDDGTRKTQIQRRGPSHRKVEAKEFQDGKRRILIFSDAGGTGFSFHASNRAKNQQRRVHYLVQAGWRADKALQGFGRTHRTDQASAPIYKLAETNIAGHKRFISTIARRLSQLGALTTGERKSKGSGLFSETDNLESEYAAEALTRLIYDLSAGRVENYTFDQFSAGLGFNKTVTDDGGNLVTRSVMVEPNTGQLIEDKIPAIPQFLNRVLALPLDEQNLVFDLFMNRLETRIKNAMEDGTYDPGTQAYRAEQMNKISDEVVFSQKGTGSKTRIVDVEAVDPIEFTKFDDLPKLGSSPVVKYVRNRKSGRIYAIKEAPKETDQSGAMVESFRRIGTSTFDKVRSSEIKTGGTMTPAKVGDEVTLPDGRKWKITQLPNKSNTYERVLGTLTNPADGSVLKDEEVQRHSWNNDGGLKVLASAGHYVKGVNEDADYVDPQGNYEEIPAAQVPALWQSEIDAADKYSRKNVTFLVGAMLPVWDRIQIEHPKIYRFTTSEGEPILGVLIPPRDVPSVRQRMGAKNTLGPQQVFDMARNDGGTFGQANGWSFRRVLVSGEHRIELSGLTYQQAEVFVKQMDGQMERIAYKPRYFIPSVESMEKVLAQSPVITLNGQDISTQPPDDAPPAAAKPAAVDPAALARFNDNLPLATWFANRYRNVRHVEFDDLMQEARIGLWKAAESFEPGRGIPFGGYASFIIRNSLNNLYTRNKATTGAKILSLNTPKHEGESATIMDSVAARIDQNARPEDVAAINEEVNKLPAKPRKIWEQFLAGKSWRDIGTEFDLSHERVRQIALATSNTLRHALAKRGIRSVDDVFPQKDDFNLEVLPSPRSQMEDEENIQADDTPTIEEETPDGAIPEDDPNVVPAAAAKPRIDIPTTTDTLAPNAGDSSTGMGQSDHPGESQGGNDVSGKDQGPGSPQGTADAYVAWLGQKATDRAAARLLSDPEKAFIAFANETGRVLPESWLKEIKPHQIKGGEEHWVFDRGDGRITKVLKPEKGYPVGGDPLEYLMRLGRLNAAAPQLDIQIPGILPSKGGKNVRIVTSMAKVQGEHPTEEFLRGWLNNHGWTEAGTNAWLHKASGIEMADAAPDNFIQVDNDVVPIDVWFSGDVTKPMFLPTPPAAATSVAMPDANRAGQPAASSASTETSQGGSVSPPRYVVIRNDYAEKRGTGGSFHDAWAVKDTQTGGIGSLIYSSENAAQRAADKANHPESPAPSGGAETTPPAFSKPSAKAEAELATIEKEGQRARAYREDAKKAAVANNGIGAQEFWKTHLSGRLDKLDFYAPGAKAAILDDRRNEALVAATINAMMDTMRQDIQKAFGYPKFWQKQNSRLQQFLDEILPTAARLEVSHLDDEGNFVFKDFQMRAGILPFKKADIIGVKPGQKFMDKGELFTVGSAVKENGGFVLLRDMLAEDQQVIFDAFHDKFPESAHYLDRFIMPGMEEARYMGPQGTMTAEFNRHALRELFNDWPQELRDLFGPMPLPDMEYVEGYTPDVAEQKTLANMISSLLRKFKSGARKFKAGEARESGNIKNLFDGFSIRALEAHREKIRVQTRQKLIEAAAVPEASIPVAEKDKYVPIDTTFAKLMESIKRAQRLDKSAFPALTEALSPADQRMMARILGDAYRLKGRGLMIHKEVERELMLGAARQVTSNALTKIFAGLLERYNSGLLATSFTTITNWGSNEVMKTMRVANRFNYAMLSALTGDIRGAKLGAYETGFLLRGFITDRFPQWQRQRIGQIVPRELFDDQTGLEAMDIDPNKSVWEQLQRLNLGGAFLKAIQYGEIDIRQKQQLAYAAYRAHAEVAADEAGIKGPDRRQWMRDWMKDAPAELHRDVYMSTVLYMMDYQNVPAWLDPQQSNSAIGQVVKRALIPFAKWPYNMARQFKRFSLDAAFDLVMPGRTREERVNGAANLMVMAGLAALGAWLVGADGGGDDDKDKLLGSNVDDEGKLQEAAFRTGNRINVSKLARIIFAHGLMRGVSFTTTDAGGREEDLYWRYRNYPYLKEGILMGLAANGKWGDFGTAFSDISGDYISLGLIAKVLGLSSFDKDKPVPYRTAEALYDVATSGPLPSTWRQFAVKVADPVMRRNTPSKSIGYDASALDAIKANTPFLSKTIPSVGKRKEVGFAPFNAEQWFKMESGSVAKDSSLSPQQKSETISDLRKQALKLSLPAITQRDIFRDAGLPVDKMAMDRTSTAPAASDIQTLRRMGVGPESYGVTTNAAGQTRLAYPDPGTVRLTKPSMEALRFFGGLNLMPVPRRSSTPITTKDLFPNE